MVSRVIAAFRASGLQFGPASVEPKADSYTVAGNGSPVYVVNDYQADVSPRPAPLPALSGFVVGPGDKVTPVATLTVNRARIVQLHAWKLHYRVGSRQYTVSWGDGGAFCVALHPCPDLIKKLG